MLLNTVDLLEGNGRMRESHACQQYFGWPWQGPFLFITAELPKQLPHSCNSASYVSQPPWMLSCGLEIETLAGSWPSWMSLLRDCVHFGHRKSIWQSTSAGSYTFCMLFLDSSWGSTACLKNVSSTDMCFAMKSRSLNMRTTMNPFFEQHTKLQ